MTGPIVSEKSAAAYPQIIRAAPLQAPDGLITGPPDFVGIGAQKSGTSWWHSLIVRHPGIYYPAFMEDQVEPPFLIKERHFFDRFHLDPFLDAHRDDYFAWFPRPKGMITGEWTPRYLADYWAAPLLKKAAPETKLLAMFRDPVERFVSGMGHTRRTNPEPSPNAALEHCWRGMYFKQLAHWLNYFERAAILILQYERCTREPIAELKRTFDFLGVEFSDYKIDPAALAERVNPAKAGTNISLHELHREALIEVYRDDVRQLVRACPGEIDLSLWKNFAA